MKFIRKGGRIIPIKEKGDTLGGRLKSGAKTGASIGSKLGAIAGGISGLGSLKKATSGQGLKSKFAWVGLTTLGGAAAGAIQGGVLGAALKGILGKRKKVHRYNMSNDVVFRRIGGRIVPIKRKLDQASKPSRNEFKTAFKAPTKKDIAPAVIVGTGFGVSIGSGVYASKAIRKASFAFGRSANIRGASKLVSGKGAVYSDLLRRSAGFKMAGQIFSRRGFGALLVGTTVGGAMASYGAVKLLNKRVSDEKKIAIAGVAGSVASGIGFGVLGRLAKMSHLMGVLRVNNPKAKVADLFGTYRSTGMSKSVGTVKKYAKSAFSVINTTARQNKKSVDSVYNSNLFNVANKLKRFTKKTDPNQGTLF